MTAKIKNLNFAHNKKLKASQREERVKADLKKLVLALENNTIPEPCALASGITDKKGKMIHNFEEDCDEIYDED